jgi:hypothetical protein
MIRAEFLVRDHPDRRLCLIFDAGFALFFPAPAGEHESARAVDDRTEFVQGFNASRRVLLAQAPGSGQQFVLHPGKERRNFV